MKWVTPRLTELAQAESDILDRVVVHPEQIAACNEIALLLSTLDSCRSAGDLYAFQEDLFQAVYSAQEKVSAMRRAVKRAEMGRRVNISVAWNSICETASTDPQEWNTERLVADRIARQYRSVGDCLAWRVYSYSRAAVIALSSGSAVGPMVGKAGLPNEREHIRSRWSGDGVFCLHHDLTTILRLGDVTECPAEGTRIVKELKAGNASTAAQDARIRLAAAAVDGSAPLPASENVLPGVADLSLLHTDVEFTTHMQQLREVAQLAEERGYQASVIGDGRLIGLLDAPSILNANADLEVVVDKYQSQKQKRMAKASPRDDSFVALQSMDFAGRNPGMAPFGLYPLPPLTRAKLICDLLLFESAVSLKRLSQRFYEQDCEFVPLLPSDGRGLNSTDPIGAINYRGIHVEISFLSLGSPLLELIRIPTYTRALRRALDTGDITKSYCLVYRDERNTWRRPVRT